VERHPDITKICSNSEFFFHLMADNSEETVHYEEWSRYFLIGVPVLTSVYVMYWITLVWHPFFLEVIGYLRLGLGIGMILVSICSAIVAFMVSSEHVQSKMFAFFTLACMVQVMLYVALVSVSSNNAELSMRNIMTNCNQYSGIFSSMRFDLLDYPTDYDKYRYAKLVFRTNKEIMGTLGILYISSLIIYFHMSSEKGSELLDTE